jgi:hypothetical protein
VLSGSARPVPVRRIPVRVDVCRHESGLNPAYVMW